MDSSKTLYLITGNEQKAKEYRTFLPDLKILDVELDEIQAGSTEAILEHKLRQALSHRSEHLLVDDTSLYFDCLNGLPGPYVKWFLRSVGIEGFEKITRGFEENGAEARTTIGYARNHEEFYFFEGAVRGEIVKPRGPREFQWDPVFQPDDFQKTFAEMTSEEKNELSMRKKAVRKLKEFLT